MRVLIRAYDLDLLRGTGTTIRAVERYLVESGDTVWATNTFVSLEEVRAWAPEVIITQEAATDEANQWATSLQVPLVMLVHGPDEYERYLPQCDLVAFNTHLQQDRARSAIGDTPSLVLHPPVLPARYATDGKGECLTLIGYDVHAFKGIEVFLSLAEALPDEQFLLVASLDRELPWNVRLQPITSDMRAIYAQTKLLLMPSVMETYGRVAVEASMSGIPTIAADLPGIREATGGYATYVDETGEWAETVRGVLRELELHRQRARMLSSERDPGDELANFRRELAIVAKEGRRRPTLSLCMVVRDEGSTLDAAIRSLAPITDEIIIGIDEGSSDESLRIAQGLASQVFRFAETSPPNFARMRNRAMERVTTDWVIMLDGHEWADSADIIRPALETTAWSLEVQMLFEPDEQRIPALSFLYPKIHRRGVKFIGPGVHEEVSTPMERREVHREIKIWHERKPGRATERRGMEKAGSELEVLRVAWEQHSDVRALFYLANGLRDAGRYDEAIGCYEDYIKNSTWDEEIWQAQLSLARCLVATGEPESARAAFEECIVMWPRRAEALVGLGHVLLALDQPQSAAAWFRVAAQLEQPEDARLFVEIPIYRWGAWHGLALALERLDKRVDALRAARLAIDAGGGKRAEEIIDRLSGENAPLWRPLFDVAVRAFSQGRRQEGAQACERLLSLEGVPADVRLQTARNQIFYAPRLSEMVPGASIREIVFPVATGWSRFNPTIAPATDGYRMIVRSSNYSVDPYMRYTFLDGGTTIKNTNYLLDLTDDLSVVIVRTIDDRIDSHGTYPSAVRGFEDCRLFRHHGTWFASATVRDRNPGNICQTALLELADKEFRALYLLSDATTGKHEKNWVPVPTEASLFFVYSCRPTVVLRYEESSQSVAEIARSTGPLIAEGFRGGSQAVSVDHSFLFIIHESVGFEDGSRVYPHRFVRMASDWTITHVSPQFFFLDRTIEYCCGLAVKKNMLIASFGAGDRTAYVATMDLNRVLTTLQRVYDS